LERGRRRSVIITTLVTVLVLGLVATKVSSMLVAQRLGERAWRDGDYAAAGRYFAFTSHLNAVERWIAPFNRGVVDYSRRAWDDAADWFEEAMELAPDSAHCRIALNWSWTLEAAGDELAEAGDDDEAALRWLEADSVLGDAVDCDKDDESSKQPSDPSPQGDEPDDEPSPDDGDDPDSEGGEDGDQAGSATSEQDQVDQTQQRLDNKRGGQRGPKPRDEEPTTENQAERLDERSKDAARSRQQAEDNSDSDDSEKSPDGPRRTW